MDEKMELLYKNQTWELIHLPKREKLISCKWVYAKKDDTSGVRFKTRLAKICAKKEGINYNKVFSPIS